MKAIKEGQVWKHNKSGMNHVLSEVGDVAGLVVVTSIGDDSSFYQTKEFIVENFTHNHALDVKECNANQPINGRLESVGDIALKDGGLTKREHFAGLAMQGLISGGGGISDVPSASVAYADEILKELGK